MLRPALAIACGLFLASPGFGQTSTSELSGTVRDPSSAVVPGANVTLENEDTGITYRQLTTAAGLYAFPAIPVGRYTITVEMKGFKTFRKTGNTVVVNTPLDVDITLEVGETSEVVRVEATTEALQTSSASIGNVVEQKSIVELPLNGRNPLALLVLEPGVVQRSYGGAGSGVHVNGSRDRAYNVTIDGIEANESTVPNPMSNLYRLTPDNVQEYKVTTSNATAEEGRNSGASISVATRSGTNQFHGTLFWFFRNTALNSNDFYSNAQNVPRADIKMNQYGVEIGGPVRKNKTFFFFSWAGQMINFNQPIDQTFGAPTLYSPSARQGNFRYFRADPNNPFVLNGVTINRNLPQLVDRNTGALLPGVRNCGSDTDLNCVAGYNFAAGDPLGIGADPSIQKLFGSYPLPNNYSVGDGLNTGTYTWNPPTQVRGPNFMARIDHTFNEKHTMFFRALWGDYNTLLGDPLNGRPQVFPGFPPLGEVERSTQNYALSWRWMVKPNMVNELTVGLSRFVFLFTQGEANPAFPDIAPYTFANSSLPYINTPRTFRAVTTPQILDNLSIIKGRHVIRTGFNFRFYQHNDVRGQPGGVNVTPTMSFSATVRPPSGFNTPGVATSTRPGINSVDNDRLLGTINDVMGIPARLSQVFLGDLTSDAYLPFRAGNSVTMWDQGQRLKQYNFYIQDEWKVSPRFTINAGLRWEINMAPTEAAGRVYVPDKSILGNEGLVTFVHAGRWFQNNNLGAIGPRLGITWSPGRDQKTVIRAGYAMAFDTLSSFQVTAVAGKVPGLTLNCSATVGGATTPGCMSVPDVRIAQGFPNELAAPTRKPSEFLTTPRQVLTNAPSLTVFDQNMQIPTVHQWNFNIQRELPQGFVVSLAYIGRRGTRLYRAYDVNQINADPILPSFSIMQSNVGKGCRPDGTGCPAGVAGAPVPIVQQGIVTSAFVNSSTTLSDISLNGAGNFAGRIEQTTLAANLRPNQQFGAITYLDSGGDSYYNAGQLTLRKRFDKGLLFGLSYTLAKSMDDQSVDPVGASSGGGLSTSNSRTPTDIRNWRNERARSDFDRRNVFTLTGVYELPFGKGKSLGADAPAWAQQVIGGWSMNGVWTAMSGEPFAVRSGVRTSNFSHESRAAIVGNTLPEVKQTEKAGIIGPVLFPDASAFLIPAPGDNGIGRNVFTAPGYWNVDLGLTKTFNVTERIRMQFRAEAFNAFNHPNFDNPRDASVSSPSIRSTQFAGACCTTVAPPSTQTIIQTGESARIIQFALKLNF